MSTLELDRDQLATLERIREERRAKGRTSPPADPTPSPAPEPKPRRRRHSCRDSQVSEARTLAIREAVAARHEPGDVVTLEAVALLADASHATAFVAVRKLRRRGDWPYLAGRQGRKPRPRAES